MNQFYLHDGRHKHGPYHPEELLQFQITKQTSVFAVGVNRWINAGEISELSILFQDRKGNNGISWKKILNLWNKVKRK